MYKTSIFQLQIVCPGCNNNIAVSGITASETCQNCGKNVNVLNVINNKMFGIMHKEKYMSGFLSGSIEQMGGDGAYKLVYSSMQPYCEECFAVIDEDTAVNAINSEKPYECTKCGHKMPVRKRDSELAEFHPKIAGVLNDAYGKDTGTADKGKEEMLVFKCMTCGAGLELTSKTKRTIKCNYCDNENYLPDVIWYKLHPNKEVQPLFVIMDLDEADITSSIDYFVNVTALNIYSKHFNNFIKQYFERPFINDAFKAWLKVFLSAKNNEQVSFNMDMTKLQKNFYDNMLLGYSAHPLEIKLIAAEYGRELPAELQKAMAVDSAEIKTALVKNPKLNKDIIKQLQSDKDPAVSTEAKKHKTGFLSKLFG